MKIIKTSRGYKIEGSPFQVKVGSFYSQSSLGNKAITGVGFKPKYVEFKVGITLTNQTRAGSGWMDHNGKQGAIDWATKLISNQAYERIVTTRCFQIRYASGATQLSAKYISMDNDGFTINYTIALSASYIILYKAVG